MNEFALSFIFRITLGIVFLVICLKDSKGYKSFFLSLGITFMVMAGVSAGRDIQKQIQTEIVTDEPASHPGCWEIEERGDTIILISKD
jgi:hypothetical protein